MNATTNSIDSDRDALVSAIRESEVVIGEIGRDDLRAQLSAARARLVRPGSVICVVGEFKQGKSALVNGMVGQGVCPEDDDIATSVVTLVRHGEKPGAVVFAERDGIRSREAILLSDVRRFVTARGPEIQNELERIEITLPNTFLEQGIRVVDMPGVGGLACGFTTATLGFIPLADGLVFVSDASAELSRPEVEFLEQARDLCPNIIFVLSKIDMYPHWRSVQEKNRAHLAHISPPLPLVATSAKLRMAAVVSGDMDLNDRSGFEPLLEGIVRDVVVPAKATAIERSRSEAIGIMRDLLETFEAERGALGDPESARLRFEELQRLEDKLTELDGPGADWSAVLSDRVTDLRQSVQHEFLAGIHAMQNGVDDRVSRLKNPAQWDALTKDLQSEVVRLAAAGMTSVEATSSRTRQDINKALDVSTLPSGIASPVGPAVDFAACWQGDGPLDKPSSGEGIFRTGSAMIRGGFSMHSPLALLGGMIPAAAAVLASTWVLAPVGGVFAGVALLDERRRRLANRRQAARGLVQTFLDDVSFEVSTDLSNQVTAMDRDLREDFRSVFSELHANLTDSLSRLRQDMAASDQEKRRRMDEVDATLNQVRTLEASLGAIGMDL